MDNLISETNSRLQEIIDNLTTIKNEYESKLRRSAKEIDTELNKVNQYKEDFFIAKQKIEKMNADIEGFEQDYQNLVERFKDDELANILIAANKEISAKIDERKRKIAKDKIAMNELVEKAELSKNKLVKITAEKKALELCLAKILDSYEFYSRALGQIIEYSNENSTNLSECIDLKSSFSEIIKEIGASSVDRSKNTFNLAEEEPIEKEEVKISYDEKNIKKDIKANEELLDDINDLLDDSIIDEEMPDEEEIDMTDAKEEEFEEKPVREYKHDKKDKHKDKNNKEKKKNNFFEDDIDLDSMLNFDDSIEN